MRGKSQRDFFPRNGLVKIGIDSGTLAFLVAVTVSISVSLSQGRAAGEPGWDDISYLIRSADLATTLQDQGLPALILQVWQNPLHSPHLNSLLLVLFLVFGTSQAIAYAANGVLIGFLVLLAWRSIPNISGRQAIWGASIFIASPLGLFLVSELRPDPAYALIAVTLMLRLMSVSSELNSPSLRSIAILFGLLLWIKPSFFVVSGLLLLAVFSLIYVVARADLKVGTSANIRLLALVGLFSIPTLLFNKGSAVMYVLNRLTGQERAIWIGEGGLTRLLSSLESLRQAGDVSGWLVWTVPLGLLVLARLASFQFIKGKQGLEIASWLSPISFLTASFIGVLIAGHTNIHFGALLLTLAVFASVHFIVEYSARTDFRWFNGLRRSFSRAGPLLPPAMAIALPLLSLHLVPTNLPFVYAVTSPPISTNSQVIEAISADCFSKSACREKYIFQERFPATAVLVESEVNWASVKWEAMKSGWRETPISSVELTETSADPSRFVVSMNYVVLADGGAVYAHDYFPQNQMQKAWVAYFASSKYWIAVDGSHLDERFLIFSRSG